MVDDARVRAAAPTVRALAEARCRTVVLSHLGRPSGPSADSSLAPVGASLAAAAGVPVLAHEEAAGPVLASAAKAQAEGGVVLAGNTRWESGETEGDEDLAAAWSALADHFVNDAFSVCHRAHASVVGPARRLPSRAGPLLRREVSVLAGLRSGPERPFWVFLGGAKLATKIPLMESLAERADGFVVGGGVANTFLAAAGHEVGESLYDAGRVEWAAAFAERARVVAPERVVVSGPEGWRECAASEISPGESALDVPAGEVGRMADEAAGARSVFWNGAFGAFETAEASEGTMTLARLLGDHEGRVVIGGGETLLAARRAGTESAYAFSSLGGGATLAYIAGETLPGLEGLGL